jgi:hypothetical protein
LAGQRGRSVHIVAANQFNKGFKYSVPQYEPVPVSIFDFGFWTLVDDPSKMPLLLLLLAAAAAHADDAHADDAQNKHACARLSIELFSPASLSATL